MLIRLYLIVNHQLFTVKQGVVHEYGYGPTTTWLLHALLSVHFVHSKRDAIYGTWRGLPQLCHIHAAGGNSAVPSIAS